MIQVALVLPFVLSGAFGVVGPRLARRGSPALATWLLTGGGIVGGVCSVVSLALLGFTFLAQLPEIAQRGHWSAAAFRAASPISRGVAFVALAALGMVMLAAVWVAVRRVWAVRYAHRACRRLAGSGWSGPIVLVDDHLQAYAVPGNPGRIVISHDLINQLTPTERRVLLAHEQAHLDLRHHWYQFAATVAAALNPLLASLPGAVRLALERWADETAAKQVGSRSRVAASLGRIALLRLHANPVDHPIAAMGASSDVAARMQALLEPPTRTRRAVVAAIIACLAVTSFATASAGERMDDLADTAGSATSHVHHSAQPHASTADQPRRGAGVEMRSW